MFVFGLAAGFRDGAPNVERLRSLMDGFPLPAPDGRRSASAPHAAAAVDRWVVVKRDEGVAASWDPERNLLFVGDVRLYNRRELAAELDHPSSHLQACADLELARIAYLKWGASSPGHLVGDFAFAAWDEQARTLFIARDHFGVRPLYYRLLSDGAVVASAIDQILTIVGRPLDEINHERIFDTFTRRARDVRQTYFRGITRVAPGCSLLIERGKVQETRFWKVPKPPSGSISYQENCERLRAAFRRAVADRLESDHPIVAHSSGGFDASTILMVADEIYRADAGRPPLIMASAVAPGYPSDESHYIDAVGRRVCFEGIRWNAVGDGPASFPGVYRSAPLLRRGLAGGPRRDLELAVERGARVMLSGVLGDGLWHATGVRRDMVRHGRWLATLRDVLRFVPNAGTARRLESTPVLGSCRRRRPSSLPSASFGECRCRQTGWGRRCASCALRSFRGRIWQNRAGHLTSCAPHGPGSPDQRWR